MPATTMPMGSRFLLRALPATGAPVHRFAVCHGTLARMRPAQG